MTINEAVEYAKSKKMIISTAALRYLYTKFKLGCPGKTGKPCVDSKKMDQLIEIYLSDRGVNNIAADTKVPYNTVYNYLTKNYIKTEKQFGRLLIIDAQEAKNVRTHFIQRV